MSSKPQDASPAFAEASSDVLPGGVLELQGRDAGAFAQAQLMNDVRALGDGQWQWSGWLNPKGRVIALGALLRLESERYWLLLPDHPAAALATQLQRFVFRSKLRLAPRDELRSIGVAAAPAALSSAAEQSRAAVRGDGWLLDWSGEAPRCLLLTPSSTELPAACARLDAAAWAVADLAHGLPRLTDGVDAGHTPQMLGLERLGAYSVKKGCYPGQEIVARTHFLGQAKRQLQRLRCAAPLAVGQELSGPGGATAQVLCAASSDARHEALAVLPIDAAGGEWRTVGSGVPVGVTGFAKGLAR